MKVKYRQVMYNGSMNIIGQKSGQDFLVALSKVFDRVKSVALWSANIRKTIRKKCPRTIRATVPQLEGKILYNVVGCICSVRKNSDKD
jgi:hypothetical protein